MNEPREIKLPGATGEMAAKIWNQGGEPTLALHGWLDNAATFDPLAPLFPELNWVALDLPGHGLSAHRPPGVAYHLVDYVADIHQVVRALGWNRFTLIGHSLGGGVTSLFASIFPEKVSRLILLESLGALTARSDELPVDARNFIEAFDALSTKQLPIYPSVERAAQARQAAGDLTLASALRLAERGTKPVPGGLTWRSDPRLRLPSPQRLTDEQIDAALARIACPTLLVRAEKGIPLIKQAMARRGPRLTQLEVVEVPGGHHVHLDSPEVVAPVVRRYLEAHP